MAIFCVDLTFAVLAHKHLFLAVFWQQGKADGNLTKHKWINWLTWLNFSSLSYTRVNIPVKSSEVKHIGPTLSHLHLFSVCSFLPSTPRHLMTFWRCGMGLLKTKCLWRRSAVRCCRRESILLLTLSPFSSKQTFTSLSLGLPSTSPVSILFKICGPSERLRSNMSSSHDMWVSALKHLSV